MRSQGAQNSEGRQRWRPFDLLQRLKSTLPWVPEVEAPRPL